MHARAISGRVERDKRDHTIDIFRDSIVPTAKKQKGFKGAYLLTDPGDGRFISITFWETETDMRASESSGYLKTQLGKIAAHFVGSPTVEHYQVSVQDFDAS